MIWTAEEQAYRDRHKEVARRVDAGEVYAGYRGGKFLFEGDRELESMDCVVCCMPCNLSEPLQGAYINPEFKQRHSKHGMVIIERAE